MKFKATLLFLTLAMISGQVLADQNHHRANYSNGYDGRSYNDRNRNNRDYGYRANGNRSNRYSRQPGNRRPMNFGAERFARWYANTAIAQVEEAHYSGCRFRMGKGRWTNNWNDHYRHGRKARRSASISEVETRDRQLRRCNRSGYHG